MGAIREECTVIERGGILYDAAPIRKPLPQWFSREYWVERGALTETAGGRGSVNFLRSESGQWVWRHYRRGGLVAKVLRDRYLWTGAARTRSFAEWRLLAELHRRELPVPRPVAARYVRSGLSYTADLITEQLPTSRTLAQALREGVGRDRWIDVGRTIARFHAQGVHHADLNAHNILLGKESTTYLLDFDRGRIRRRGAWEQRVLLRLRRSLEKVSAQHGSVFDPQQWDWLLSGYGPTG